MGSGAARGEMRWIREDPLLYVKWKDRHDVAMCSTIHKACSGESMERCVRDPNGGWAKRVIPLPDPVKEYDEYMGGWGDLSNTLIKYFSLGPNKNQWYKRLFLHFVDIVVVNSFIISLEMAEVKKQKPLKMKSFRKALCEQLAAAGKD